MDVKLIQASSMDGIFAGYRECHASQGRSDSGGDKDRKLVKRLLFECDPVHDSPIEHAIYTWRISGVSRALSHQLVRHRIASFSQRSQRYVNEKQFDYVVPESMYNKFYQDKNGISEPKEAVELFHYLMKLIQGFYENLISAGVPKEDARFVLPNACCTSLIVTMNPRAFRNFLKLRLDTHAQWEIRALAKAMLESIPEDHKFMYEDLIK